MQVRDKWSRSALMIVPICRSVPICRTECTDMQDRDKWVKLCSDDLKSHLEGMIDAVFGPVEKKFVHPNT
jgi:hypothetical protein